MTNLTKEEYARLHLKAKRGMLTAEERAALEAYEDAAQPAPQTPVPADTETLLCSLRLCWRSCCATCSSPYWR